MRAVVHGGECVSSMKVFFLLLRCCFRLVLGGNSGRDGGPERRRDHGAAPVDCNSASAAEAAPLASSLSLSTLDVLRLELEEERDARPAADAPRARLLGAAGVAVASSASMPVRDAERDERREGRAAAVLGGDFFLGAIVRVFWMMLWTESTTPTTQKKSLGNRVTQPSASCRSYS